MLLEHLFALALGTAVLGRVRVIAEVRLALLVHLERALSLRRCPPRRTPQIGRSTLGRPVGARPRRRPSGTWCTSVAASSGPSRRACSSRRDPAPGPPRSSRPRSRARGGRGVAPGAILLDRERRRALDRRLSVHSWARDADRWRRRLGDGFGFADSRLSTRSRRHGARTRGASSVGDQGLVSASLSLRPHEPVTVVRVARLLLQRRLLGEVLQARAGTTAAPRAAARRAPRWCDSRAPASTASRPTRTRR